MLITLIRHGATEWNEANLIQGSRNIGLSPRGRRQARSAAARLRRIPFKALYSSPLRRAADTAQIIGRHLRLPVALHPRLGEQNFGRLEGLPLSTLLELSEEEMQGGIPVAPPDGETRQEFSDRVFSFLNELCAAEIEDPIAVVTHQGVIKLLFDVAHRQQPEARTAVANGTIHIFEQSGLLPEAGRQSPRHSLWTTMRIDYKGSV